MGNLIVNSDDFGIDIETNLAVLEGHSAGIVTSASILANGPAYFHGINEILPQTPNLGKGIHLNLTSGESLTSPSLFSDNYGKFNKKFGYFLQRGLNKKLNEQIEKEFRAQIEKVLADTKVDHLNSHNAIHSIPYIFNIVLKLAIEYDIKNVRLNYERPYIIPKKMLNIKYPGNFLRMSLLNIFSILNKSTVLNLNSKTKIINTNDYLIGTGYKNFMDENSIICGLWAIKGTLKKHTVEIVLHPKSFETSKNKTNYQEFLSTINPVLKEKIKLFDTAKLTNYKAIH